MLVLFAGSESLPNQSVRHLEQLGTEALLGQTTRKSPVTLMQSGVWLPVAA